MSTTSTPESTLRAPDGRRKEALQEQITGLEEWAQALPCQRPVRMLKHGVNESTGEIAAEGKEVLMRCGTRLASRCPSCAALYRGDTRAILYAGLRAALDDDEQLIFLTLTAPSFGKTHQVAPTPPPRLSSRQKSAWLKRYHHPCGCGLTHAPGDTRWKGLPLSPSSYDYEGQVKWNAAVGRLWSRTADELTRALGLPERVSYLAVAEWQARGAIHLHVIIRVPATVALGLVSDPARKGKRSTVVEQACHAAATYAGRGRSGHRMQWGTQLVAEAVTTERTAFRTAGYLAKLVNYAVKDLDQSGSDSCRPRAAMVERHHERLNEAAEHLECGGPGTDQRRLCHYRQTGHSMGIPMENARRERCRSLRHRQWGFRGHVVRKSRTWASLTMGECRRRRAEHWKLAALAEGRDLPEEEEAVVWERPNDGQPMQLELHAWPLLRDGLLASLKTQLLNL